MWPRVAALTVTALVGAALAPLHMACGASVEQLRIRERCYIDAEDRAQQRVDAECPGSFTNCAAAPSIMLELRETQEACP